MRADAAASKLRQQRNIHESMFLLPVCDVKPASGLAVAEYDAERGVRVTRVMPGLCAKLSFEELFLLLLTPGHLLEFTLAAARVNDAQQFAIVFGDGT